jgi:fructose-specific phosphotransferase system component IIB
MMVVRKTALSGTPEDVSRKLDEACRDMVPHEYTLTARLRELAQELAGRDNVSVSIATYGAYSVELQVTPSQNGSSDPILLARDKTGESCQISWGRWKDIQNETARREVVDLVLAMLAIQAAPPKGGE